MIVFNFRYDITVIVKIIAYGVQQLTIGDIAVSMGAVFIDLIYDVIASVWFDYAVPA